MKKFITEKHIEFINRVNKLLIQKIVGQEVIYYAVSLKHSNVHRFYRESVEKTTAAPVRVNALVSYNNPNTTSTNHGLDSKYELEVYFHNQELIERNLVPKEGDFIEFGEIFFEITSVTQPQLIYGEPHNKIMTKCICVPAREGQFQFGSDSEKDVSNTHPTAQNMSDDE